MHLEISDPANDCRDLFGKRLPGPIVAAPMLLAYGVLLAEDTSMTQHEKFKEIGFPTILKVRER